MSWFNRKGDAQPSTPSAISFHDDFSDDHLGVMASPNYCNEITCWCHTNVAYHDAVTSLPTSAPGGDDVYRAFSFFLDQP